MTSVQNLFIFICTMYTLKTQVSSSACHQSTDQTAVSLSDNIYQYAMEMQCSIFGTDVLIWKINGLEVQQFFVGGGMTNANTMNCSFNVVWRNVSDRSIQSVMTCWSPDGWAGMNVTCQSDNIASCSLVKSAAISPTTRDPSTGNFPPITNVNTSKNTTSHDKDAVIGGITAGVVVILVAVASASGFICWYVCRMCKKNATVDITNTSLDTSLNTLNTTLNTTVDTIPEMTSECTANVDRASIRDNIVMPKVTVARSRPQRAAHRADEGSNEEERTGEESNIQPMQTYCDPLDTTRDHGSGDPPSGGPSIQEVSGSEAPSLAVHGPPPVLFAVPPEEQIVLVQPGHGKEYTSIEIANIAASTTVY